MSDLLTYKSYSRFVINYLSELLNKHSSGIGKRDRVLSTDQFVSIFKSIFINGELLNKELQQTLFKQYPPIKQLALNTEGGDHDIFPAFIRLVCKEGMSDKAVNETLNVLKANLSYNKAALHHWRRTYTSFIPESAKLLGYLDENWSKLPEQFKRKSDLKETLEAFKQHNLDHMKKDGVPEASLAIKVSESFMQHKCLQFFLLSVCSIFYCAA